LLPPVPIATFVPMSFRTHKESPLAARNGGSPTHGSFGLPNGQRITTVRRDIMDRALNRSPERKG